MSVGRGEFVLYLSFFALSLIYLIFSGSPVENMLPRSPVIMSSEEVKVVIFGEALCPDTERFFLDLPEILANFKGNNVKVQYVPYGNAKTLEDGTVECQHGVPECELNEIHACMIEQSKSQEQWMEAIVETFRHFKNMKESSPAAAEKAGLEWAAVEKCVKTDGAALHRKYGELTHQQKDLVEVPWVTVNKEVVRVIGKHQELTKKICSFLPAEGVYSFAYLTEK